jgi:hypothetical protein
MKATTNEPTFLYDDLPLYWQMTRWEKYAFGAILEAARPQVALEIGTYQGGSLQLIAQSAAKVYSVDIDPTIKERLGPRFPNVEFLAGDSRSVLPELLARIGESDEDLGFVLIDGDHSADGVRHDINAVLRYTPRRRPMFIVFHDSFHPPCREGIMTADWTECPYVHYVEVDFIPGVYHFEAFDTAGARTMFGGLAMAVMRPEPRTEPLVIHQSQKGLFEAVFRSSSYVDVATRSPLLVRALRKARRIARAAAGERNRS